jgi:hypothetical protein
MPRGVPLSRSPAQRRHSTAISRTSGIDPLSGRLRRRRIEVAFAPKPPFAAAVANSRSRPKREPLVATLRIFEFLGKRPSATDCGHVDGAHVNPSSSIFAALRSGVVKPSVNQP